MPHPSIPATCKSFYMLALAKFLSRPRGGFFGFLMRGLVGQRTERGQGTTTLHCRKMTHNSELFPILVPGLSAGFPSPLLIGIRRGEKSPSVPKNTCRQGVHRQGVYTKQAVGSGSSAFQDPV